MENGGDLGSDSGYVCGSFVPLSQFVSMTAEVSSIIPLAALWTLVWVFVWYGCTVVARLLIKYVWPPSKLSKENCAIYEGRNLATVVRAVVVAGHAFLVLRKVSLKLPRDLYEPSEYMIAATDAGVFLFWTFDLADLILGLIHGLLGLDMIVHHLVFIAASLVGTVSCFGRGHWALAASVLLSLEVSTPALTYSLTMRNRVGGNHWSIKLSLLFFAALFVIFRICLYTFMLTRLYVHFYDATPSHFHMHGYVAATLFSCGAVLQYYWGFLIVNKVLRQVKRDSSNKGVFSSQGTLGALLLVLLFVVSYVGGFLSGYPAENGYVCGSSAPFSFLLGAGNEENNYMPLVAYCTLLWVILWYVCVFVVKLLIFKVIPTSSLERENSVLFEGRNLATVVRAFVSAGLGLSVLIDAWQNTPGAYYNPTMYTLRTTDIGVLLIGTFDLADLILGMMHGLLGKDIIMHHIVFVALTILSATTCFAGGRQPICASVILSTEISTPALSYSLSMRNRLGERHYSVRLSFLIFAILFFIFRIGLYSLMLGYLFANLRSFTPERFFGLVPIGSVLLVSGAAIQYYWGVRIVRIFLQQLTALPSQKSKST